MIPAYAGGTPPNAAEVSHTQSFDFAGRDIHIPLNDFTKRDKTTSQALADLSPGQLRACTWRNQQYFYPITAGMEIWYYNPDFFQRANLQRPQLGWWRSYRTRPTCGAPSRCSRRPWAT